MTCIVPSISSPGKLFLRYNKEDTIGHTTRANLLAGIDPGDTGALHAEAETWAALMGACLPSDFKLTGWGIMNPAGGIIYEASLDATITGTHGADSGLPQYNCTTVSITGKGLPVVAGGCQGNTRTEMFVGNGYRFTEGMKGLAVGDDSALDALALFLLDSATIWADRFGQTASTRGVYPVQFNAAAQRRDGS